MDLDAIAAGSHARAADGAEGQNFQRPVLFAVFVPVFDVSFCQIPGRVYILEYPSVYHVFRHGLCLKASKQGVPVPEGPDSESAARGVYFVASGRKSKKSRSKSSSKSIFDNFADPSINYLVPNQTI